MVPKKIRIWISDGPAVKRERPWYLASIRLEAFGGKADNYSLFTFNKNISKLSGSSDIVFRLSLRALWRGTPCLLIYCAWKNTVLGKKLRLSTALRNGPYQLCLYTALGKLRSVIYWA
mgnify:CR=1 FL=1